MRARVLHAFGSAAGRRTRKRVPTPGWLSTRSAPPWLSTMRCTVARPRPGAVGLGRVERIEDPLQVREGDPASRIRDDDLHGAGALRPALSAVGDVILRRAGHAARRDAHHARAFERLERVAHQVPEHLPQLGRRRRARRRPGRPRSSSCAPGGSDGLEHARHLVEQRRQRNRLELGRRRPRVLEEVADQRVEAPDLAQHDVHQTRAVLAAPRRCESSSTEPEIAASGLRISCAMLAASSPTPARRSRRRSSCSICTTP